MAVSTRKQLVNKVLKKLREDTLTGAQTISDVPYAETIAEFINDVKEEVEDAWNWTQLRNQLSFTTVAGTSTYNLGNSSSTNIAFTVIDSSNNVIVIDSVEGYDTEDASNERTQILSMYNVTKDIEMTKKSDNYFNRQNKLVSTPQSESPMHYRISGMDSNGNIIVDLYPIPNGEYTIESWCYVPQDPLITDASQLVLSCAETAIVYGTWAMAISERGEDGGQLYDEVVRKYNDYLSTAISRDRELKSSTDEGHEGDWMVV